MIPSPTPTTENEITDEVFEDDYDNSDQLRRRGKPQNKRRGGKAKSQSAGRKEAARLYPLDGTRSCEWQGQANAGGGDYPILGCPPNTGKQEARHHGPDKNVTTNEPGNVHRICHYCHYRWHAKNNPGYNWNAGIWPPHNPRPMTKEELQIQVIDYMRYLTTGKRSNRKVKIDD